MSAILSASSASWDGVFSSKAIRMRVIGCDNFSNQSWRMMPSSMCLRPRRPFMNRRSWEGILSSFETLLRSPLDFALSDLSSLESMASFSSSNCSSIGGYSRISSASTTYVNIIRCEVILLLEKMASSWWTILLVSLYWKVEHKELWSSEQLIISTFQLPYNWMCRVWKKKIGCRWWWRICIFKSCVELLSLCYSREVTIICRD